MLEQLIFFFNLLFWQSSTFFHFSDASLLFLGFLFWVMALLGNGHLSARSPLDCALDALPVFTPGTGASSNIYKYDADWEL